MPDCRSAAIKAARRPLRDNRTATIMPTPRPPDSHPDRRCSLIQIAAQQLAELKTKGVKLRDETPRIGHAGACIALSTQPRPATC
jgi:hypothetical protein